LQEDASFQEQFEENLRLIKAELQQNMIEEQF